MHIIVADRGGIGGAAIRHALETNMKWGTVIIPALEWRTVEGYLKVDEDVVVISGQMLKGFRTQGEFASRVKGINPDAGFFVYNCPQMELDPDIDGYVPTCSGKVTIASVIMPFFKDMVRRRACRTGQLRLF